MAAEDRLQRFGIPTGTRIGDFDLGPIIQASGAWYARVATHTAIGDGKFFVIRVMPKALVVQNETIEHIKREREILLESDIYHPLLQEAGETFQDYHNLYLLNEFCVGGELYKHLRSEDFNRFHRHRARLYAAQVVLALDYLHSMDIAHRDLKPENIMFTAEGYVKLGGFCLSKFVKARTTTFCGTPEYMAPEIILHTGYNTAVDWWALGILLYEMILGQPPYVGRFPMDLFRQIIAKRPKFRRTPQGLEVFDSDSKHLICKLMEKNPIHRYGSFQEGAKTIKRHPFFDGIDWDKVASSQSSIPGIVPVVTGPLDLQHYDVLTKEDWDASCPEQFQVVDPKLDEEDDPFLGY